MGPSFSTRNRDCSGNSRRKSWSAFARLQKESGAGRSKKRLAVAMLPNGVNCQRWRRNPAAHDSRRHLRVVRRVPRRRARTHRKSPLSPRTIGNKPGVSVPLVHPLENSVPPADAPQKVPRISAPAGRRGRKKIAVPAHRHHSVRFRVVETAVQGIAAARPPQGQPRDRGDRLTGSAPAQAAPAEAAHSAPSRPGTRGKTATVRDSIKRDHAPKQDQAPVRAIGQDLKPQDRPRLGPLNSGQRIRSAIDRDWSRPAARDRLRGTAAPDCGHLHQPVRPAARAWLARSRPAPANLAPAARDQAVSQPRPPGVRTADRRQAPRARQALGQPGKRAGSPSPIMETRAGRRRVAASDPRRRTLHAAPEGGRVRIQRQSGQVEGSGIKLPPVVRRIVWHRAQLTRFILKIASVQLQ